jgi:hypothetical protein
LTYISNDVFRNIQDEQIVFQRNKNERVVTETPRNGHSIAKINGYYCVDSETKSFTGKYVVRGYDNELRKEAHYKNGKLNGVYLEYTTRDTVYVKVRANYLNNKKFPLKHAGCCESRK